MGRPPKPTALKVLHGDFKGHPGRQNKDEPQIAGSDIDPPEGLSSEAKKIWEYNAPHLLRAGVLTPVDRDALAEYAESTVIVKLARHRIMLYVTGKLDIRPGMSNPFNEYSRAIAVMTNIGGRLGLTPADRTRLTVTREEAPDDLIING
jgi:P27 family predicted phage terminase small subunit